MPIPKPSSAHLCLQLNHCPGAGRRRPAAVFVICPRLHRAKGRADTQCCCREMGSAPQHIPTRVSPSCHHLHAAGGLWGGEGLTARTGSPQSKHGWVGQFVSLSALLVSMSALPVSRQELLVQDVRGATSLPASSCERQHPLAPISVGCGPGGRAKLAGPHPKPLPLWPRRSWGDGNRGVVGNEGWWEPEGCWAASAGGLL